MSTLKNITLSTTPDITDVQDNFNTLNADKIEVSNIIQGQNIQITVDGKNITFSALGGGGTGQDGVSLQYHWDGTSLGIKREDEINYTYVNLKGQDGVIGVDGKSAYQSWLDLGNTGTEQGFIDSNKGENGRNIEMRYDEAYLQYRLVGDTDWINLIQLTQTEIDLIALTARVDAIETNQGDLTVVPTELQNKTIAEMITSNFTSVSNGKTLVANAITGKGVPTLATDTFQVMADNIELISGGVIDNKIYLYKDGNEFTNISGGWVGLKSPSAAVTGTFAKQVDRLYIQNSATNQGLYAVTNNKYDITQYGTLYMEIEGVSILSTQYDYEKPTMTIRTGQTDGNAPAFTRGSFTIGVPYVISLNISSFTGLYYVALQTLANSFYIRKVWLE